MEPVVDGVGADGRRHAHPDQVWVLAVLRRDAIGEEQTTVGQGRQTQTVFPVEPLDFVQRPGGTGGGGQEIESRHGDGGGGVG